MSWTDEEIDKLVNDAAASQKVTYNDAYWTEMEAMLNNQSGKKGMFWWTGLAVVLAITGIGGALLLRNNGKIDSTNRIAINANGKNVSRGIDIPLNAKEMNNDTSKTEEDNDLKNLKSQNNKKIKGLNRNASRGENTIQNNKTILQPNKTKSAGKFNSIKHNKVGKSVSSYNRESDNTASNSSTNNSSSTTRVDRDLSSVNTMNPNYDEKVLDIDELSSPKFLEIETSTKIKNENVSNLELRNWYVASNVAPISTFSELPLFPRNKLGFYVEAKAGIGKSYIHTEKNNAIYQIGLAAGVEYFKHNWIFGAGFGIRQQFAQNIELNRNVTHYSFGAVHTNQRLSYDQFLFLDLPISIDYQFNKSAIGVQFTPTYLLGSRLSYSVKTDEIIGDKVNSRVDNSDNKSFVRSDNFETFGCNLGIHYSYSIFNNLSLSATLSSRFGADMLRTRFENSAVQVPLMFEIGIKKRF